MTTLITAHLTLSPCCPDDSADFMALERDPEVMFFLNGGAVDHQITRPEEVTFLMPRGTEPHVWTVRRTADGEFVGWFCLFPESPTRAEIGYRLGRRHWGQGLASEGVAALVNWGFGTAGYDQIEACTHAMNHGSRRVMEKIGMGYVRSVPCGDNNMQDGEHVEVWYALRRAQWRGR